MKKNIYTIIVSSITMIILAGCQSSEQSVEKKTPPQIVTTKQARTDEISQFQILSGRIEPYKIVTLSSASEGPVADISVREGDIVKHGNELMVIGRRQAVEASVTAAMEQLKTEKQNFQRIKQLVDSGALPGEKLEEAQVNLGLARAQLARTQEIEQDYKVLAPWNGVISKVFVQAGDYVSPRSPLIEMFDLKSLVLQFAVPEKHAMNIRQGLMVDVFLDAYPEQRVHAEITRIYPELDTVTHTRTMEAVLKSDFDLLKGMLARIYLPVSTRNNAVTIPESAVIVSPTGDHVVYVFNDGIAHMRTVTIGIENENRVEVLGGIKPGEIVIVRGNETLKDGMRVALPSNGGNSPSVITTGGAE